MKGERKGQVLVGARRERAVRSVQITFCDGGLVLRFEGGAFESVK